MSGNKAKHVGNGRSGGRTGGRGLLSLGRAAVLAAGAIAAGAGGAPAQELPPPGWTMTWRDEFDGSTLDGSKWRAENAALVKNNEQQYYSPANVSVANGQLTILSERRAQGGRPYTSGLIESVNRFSQAFGRFEIRAKLPSTRGMWPAIWMLRQAGGWPPEIDIMELLGHQPSTVYMSHHWGVYPAVQTTTESYTGPNFSSDFHTFTLEWFPERLDFYVDGVRRSRQTISVPRDAFYLIINTAVGGNWPGNPDASTIFPQRMLVDYVRVYRRNVLNESFDDRGPSGNQPLLGWTTYGNAFVDTGFPRTGSNSAKLFGQFNGGYNSSGLFQEMAVTPGQRWRASAYWLNRSLDRMQGANQAVIKLEWYDAAGSLLEANETVALTASSVLNTYLQRAVQGAAPPGAARVRLALVFVQPASAAGAAFVDDVLLEQVCAADFNGDAAVDPDDLSDFIGCFFATPACPEADFNADGLSDPDDLSDFISAFFGSCV